MKSPAFDVPDDIIQESADEIAAVARLMLAALQHNDGLDRLTLRPSLGLILYRAVEICEQRKSQLTESNASHHGFGEGSSLRVM